MQASLHHLWLNKWLQFIRTYIQTSFDIPKPFYLAENTYEAFNKNANLFQTMMLVKIGPKF